MRNLILLFLSIVITSNVYGSFPVKRNKNSNSSDLRRFLIDFDEKLRDAFECQNTIFF